MPDEPSIAEAGTPPGMNAEQRGTLAVWLDGNHDREARGRRQAPQPFCQVCDGTGFEQCSEWQGRTETFTQPPNELHREERVAAKVKEVVKSPNRTDTEQSFP